MTTNPCRGCGHHFDIGRQELCETCEARNLGFSYADARDLGQKAAQNGDPREWVLQLGRLATRFYDEEYTRLCDPEPNHA